MKKPIRERDFNVWTTADEIRYIRSIGKHGQSFRVKNTSKVDMLEMYLELAKIKPWGDIDGDLCVHIAQDELMKAKEERR